ncbi:MAG: hypothetical protein ACR2RF_14830 [Geminicoccaceae bacterium]
MADARWPTIIAIPILLVASYLEWYWVWGGLFVYWTVPAMLSGEVLLVEPITRSDHPILFWIIIAMWLGFGVWTIVADLSWRLA